MKKQYPKSIKLSFPAAEGKYWFLMWIGPVRYDAGQRKVEFYFYNKKTPKDDYRDLDFSCLEKKVCPASYLSELEIGSIYNIDREKFEVKNNGRIYNISIEENLHLSKKRFPLNRSKYFIRNADEIVPLGYSYLEADPDIEETDDIKVVEEKEKTNILISPYTILQYFLFYNDKLIKKTFSGELIEYFKINEMKFRKCENTGKIIGILYYDAAELREDEAVVLSPYMFLKKSAGVNFLRSIYSNIEKGFQNSETKKTYLDFSWYDFTNYKIEVQGKYYYTGFGNDYRYLHSYRINKFQFKDENPYIVDKIELFPINSKKSTKDRKNHIPKNEKRPILPSIKGLSLNLNSDSAKPISPVLSKEKKNFDNPFKIPVELIERDTQLEAYITYFPNNDDIKDVVRDLENLAKEAESIRENIRNYDFKIEKFKYFEELISILKRLVNSKFNLEIDSYPNTYLRNYYIAEISKFSRYMYLVEFGNGIIGIFNEVELNKISIEQLNPIVESFLEFKKEVENGKVLWTYIKNKKEKEFEKEGIIIHTGIKHLIASGQTEEDTVNKSVAMTARNLYTNRIKNILSK